MNIFITGGAGFIGSVLIRHLLSKSNYTIINIDKLTYSSNLAVLDEFSKNPNYHFHQTDICDAASIQALFDEYQPAGIIHLAAESHVDRSIDGPAEFINSNIVGTYTLLEAARSYWNGLDVKSKNGFRFHHVSTDEVYGDLEPDQLSDESYPYQPSSPYSASKAASDHLVRAWHRTYGIPVVITNCSNNYGPYQFPEKLIPLMILNALDGLPLPVYGDGNQIRDWLYVDDHARAIVQVFEQGIPGETYNIGGNNQKKNIEVVNLLCDLLEQANTKKPDNVTRFHDLITFVTDRPGHDNRYAIDCSKIYNELGWEPQESFESGLRKSVLWYLDNIDWCEDIKNNRYQRQRLGLNTK